MAKEGTLRSKDAWAISADNTALLVVDMQRAFLDEGAPLETPGGRVLVPKINQLTARCRQLRIPVIFLKWACQADLSDMGLLRDMNARQTDDEWQLIEGKKGAEFHPDLDVRQDDYIVPKVRFSALIPGSSMLEPLLRGLGRNSFIICGVVTDVCVAATTIDGMMLDFKVFFVSDLSATSSAERQKITLELLDQLYAKVITYDEVMKELGQLSVRIK